MWKPPNKFDTLFAHLNNKAHYVIYLGASSYIENILLYHVINTNIIKYLDYLLLHP